MTRTSHDSFTLERHYDSPRQHVFDCWAKPELRERWFGGGEGWSVVLREQDFRVGGHERLKGAAGRPEQRFPIDISRHRRRRADPVRL